jgi:hypothetical protein
MMLIKQLIIIEKVHVIVKKETWGRARYCGGYS